MSLRRLTTSWAKLVIPFLGLSLCGAWKFEITHAAAPDSDGDLHAIKKYNPLLNQLEDIAREDLKVGYIYNHYNHKLNRRVWSYWQNNGEFWNAFGEGTKLEAWRFDLGINREEALTKLKEFNPELAEHLEQSGQILRFRLDAEGKWVSSGTTAVLSIYDQETGRRWEKHSNRFIPVSHTGGYRWRIHNGKYVPDYTKP